MKCTEHRASVASLHLEVIQVVPGW